MTGSTVTGTVEWFNDINGFGYITADDGGRVKVSYAEIKTPGYKILHEGQRVRFSIEETVKGPVAKNVLPME
jgi:cold shock protein